MRRSKTWELEQALERFRFSVVQTDAEARAGFEIDELELVAFRALGRMDRPGGREAGPDPSCPAYGRARCARIRRLEEP
jgi:hypothetical protein